MPRGEQRVKVSIPDDQKELQKYFNQMVGDDTPDASIVVPKLARFMDEVMAIQTALQGFVNVLGKFDDYTAQADELTKFAAEIAKLIANVGPAEGYTSRKWMDVKEHDVTRTCLMICNNLIVIHTHLKGTWDDVDRKFMDRYSGATLAPFPFSQLDFKYLWLVHGEGIDGLRELLFSVLQVMWTRTYEIYQLTHSPDVDVSALSKKLVESIGKLSKHIRGCDLAFAQIKKSVGMLETNFDGYYKDFLESKDPNNIFTNFIADVSTSCESDSRLVFQCKRIVQYYRKKSQQQAALGKSSGKKNLMFDTLLKHYDGIEAKAIASVGGIPADKENDDLDDATFSDDDAPAEDDRDLDTLMAAINNPKKKTVPTSKSRPKEKSA
jgi:hypothetical protein